MKIKKIILITVIFVLSVNSYSQRYFYETYTLTVCTSARDAICDLYILNKSGNTFAGVIVVDDVEFPIFGWYTFKQSGGDQFPYNTNGLSFYRYFEEGFQYQMLYKGIFNYDHSKINGEYFVWGNEFGFSGVKTQSSIKNKYINKLIQQSDEFDENNFISIYPNPVKNIINITNYSDCDKIEIFNIKGELIQYHNYNASIDVSSLKPGIYILKLSNNEQELETIQFIKE